MLVYQLLILLLETSHAIANFSIRLTVIKGGA